MSGAAKPKIILPGSPEMTVRFDPALIVRSYDDYVAAMVRRRRQLGLSLEELDYRARWEERYSSHLENWRSPHGRCAGPMSMARWQETLGVVFLQIDYPPDEEAERPFLNGADLSRRIIPAK